MSETTQTTTQTLSPSDRPWNPPRQKGKARVKPWPIAAEREWTTDRHEFVWELPDEAYESLRLWVARVEAGEPKALALAEACEICVVHRHRTGVRDRLQHPEEVLGLISDALYDNWSVGMTDRMSIPETDRLIDLKTAAARELIVEIFGSDPGDVILLLTQHSHEAGGQEDYDLQGQRDRAERRLELGTANARDRAIAALGADYWR
ncbi:hypothetical protein ASF60_18060 [Methylobacterium sp. Leaf113]|uniref:hypothetical protein n=1 Tax=Methylobacterium sp. Leaf113 TaxID=1736259 RepID=UPI0006F9E506|nr:hypothetical protein [Methylobacterium sp. Leaf113]KQP91349.1 hypothetical protein ASF60_18060 [Methylobacterium sp. Leaf113]